MSEQDKCRKNVREGEIQQTYIGYDKAERIVDQENFLVLEDKIKLERICFSKSLKDYWNNIIKEYEILKNSEIFSKKDSTGENYFLGISEPGLNKDNKFFDVVMGSSNSQRSIQNQMKSVYYMTDNFHDMNGKSNYSQNNEENRSSMSTFKHVDNVKQNSYHSIINSSEITPISEFMYVSSIKYTNDGYYDNTDIKFSTRSTRKQADILQNR
ncbi:1737_t:CDS:2 [Funneliformis geosporum]|uniref:1737_t:CDS:1 n=1 Tax=Funneliformis geosporum TaxID=1117311 RepID=A0A9W4WQ55_9GLOM|nr:1737_t:CDS:2 [Funneliformis geosporum]